MTKNSILSALIVSVVLIGCAGHTAKAWEKVRTRNQQALLELEIGMSKANTLRILGTDEDKIRKGLTGSSRIPNPFKRENYQSDDGLVEVLFYYTDVQKWDGTITDDELTPIFFKNGKLIGWGRSFTDKLKIQ
jgi:hypothetical protein